jgi:4-hydroxy-tetrahydrodipicolinate synthase
MVRRGVRHDGGYGPWMPPVPRTPRLPLSLPTAMDEDGSLDADGQTALAAVIADAGADAVHVLDLIAGEVMDLDDDERAAVVQAARRGSGGLPLVAGVGRAGVTQVATAQRLADAGADLLVVPLGGPAERWADALGRIASLGLPVVVQHHPGATGALVPAATLAALAVEVEAVAVLHEGVPVPDVVTGLVAGQVDVLGGLGGLLLPEELDAGALGTAAASAVPELLTDVVRRHRAGDHGAAREQHLLACGYLRLEAGSAGPVVRKEAWRQRGILRTGRVRRGSPLGPATKTTLTRRLRDVGVELRAPWPGA